VESKEKAEPAPDPAPPADSDSDPVTPKDRGNDGGVDSIVGNYVKATNKSEKDARSELNSYSQREFNLDLAELSEEDIRQLEFHVAVGNVQ
jgi:hypothetical protein